MPGVVFAARAELNHLASFSHPRYTVYARSVQKPALQPTRGYASDPGILGDTIMRTYTLLSVCLGLAVQLLGQPGGTPRVAQPMSMPGDRSEDSYAIYSQLLKSGPI